MKKTDLDDLLSDALRDDDGASPLAAALGEARRRRHRRTALRGTAAIALACAAIFAVLHFPSRPSPMPVAQMLPPTPTPASSPRPHLLTDDELFATLEGMSYAIIGEPGVRQIIFLGPPPDE